MTLPVIGNFDHQPGIRRDDITPLAAGHYLSEARNVVLLGPPGTGKTHVAIALGVAACRTGQRDLFATATDWVARLQDAHQRGRLPAELTKLRRHGLIIIDLCRHRDYAEVASWSSHRCGWFRSVWAAEVGIVAAR